jgi:chondroitin synthase
MGILQDAIAHFKNGEYSQALALYETAERVFGTSVVGANIRICRERLGLSRESGSKHLVDGDVQKANGLSPDGLDPATAYMLYRAGVINLKEPEARKLLDKHQALTQRKSSDAKVKKVNPIPSDWPKELTLAPLPDSTNDYIWWRKKKSHKNLSTDIESKEESPFGLSVIVPTFNRSKILDVTLACLVNQNTVFRYEVIVADDGSREDIVAVTRRYENLIDIKYVRQRDYGYQLCAVRNLGMRTAKYRFIAILDCDMAPNPLWVESYMGLLQEDDDVALIGPRKYIDTSNFDGKDFLESSGLLETLPEVITNNDVSGKKAGEVSLDWRLQHFKDTEDLRLCDTPFRYFSGGNVAFSKKWLSRVGWFDEEFTHWGGEDNEFGYRLYRQGCFFRAVWGAMAYHQEPPGKENETDRAEGKRITLGIVMEKVPYFYRKITPLANSVIHKMPLVSIYIPAYNCSENIVRCVDSALNQTITDLEVCVCNDGSTDSTLEVLKSTYGENPRVKIVDKSNGGIGSASNAAVNISSGFYIGQLDSDDYLEPDAVELCLREFMSDRRLACVYTTNRNVDAEGKVIADGYNWPVFSREKLTTAMIAHHFRMFTIRAFNLTAGFDETIANAVDYDMYLKLSEVGDFRHINKVSYNRVLHGENTSIKKIRAQKTNHFYAQNRSLRRQLIRNFELIPTDDDDAGRKGQFRKLGSGG